MKDLIIVKSVVLLCVLVLIAAPLISAQEEVEVTKPAVAADVVKLRPVRIIMDLENQDLQIRFREYLGGVPVDGGVVVTHQWVATEAVTLMKQINKADFSTKSLIRRIMEKAQADGKLSGTIIGAPE